MSSGTRKTKKWVIEFPPQDRPDPNALMGWAQSVDTIKQMKLQFDSLEQAQAYCQKKSLEFIVVEPEQRTQKSKAYADNFRFNKFS